MRRRRIGFCPSPCPSPGPPPSSIKAVVRWDAPQSYTDNTLLVPSRDVQGYEIYLRQDLSFGPADNPVATAPSVDTSFDSRNAFPPAVKGSDLLRFRPGCHHV